jgi:hypothetical protein
MTHHSVPPMRTRTETNIVVRQMRQRIGRKHRLNCGKDYIDDRDP